MTWPSMTEFACHLIEFQGQRLNPTAGALCRRHPAKRVNRDGIRWPLGFGGVILGGDRHDTLDREGDAAHFKTFHDGYGKSVPTRLARCRDIDCTRRCGERSTDVLHSSIMPATCQRLCELTSAHQPDRQQYAILFAPSRAAIWSEENLFRMRRIPTTCERSDADRRPRAPHRHRPACWRHRSTAAWARRPPATIACLPRQKRSRLRNE